MSPEIASGVPRQRSEVVRPAGWTGRMAKRVAELASQIPMVGDRIARIETVRHFTTKPEIRVKLPPDPTTVVELPVCDKNTQVDPQATVHIGSLDGKNIPVWRTKAPQADDESMHLYVGSGAQARIDKATNSTLIDMDDKAHGPSSVVVKEVSTDGAFNATEVIVDSRGKNSTVFVDAVAGGTFQRNSARVIVMGGSILIRDVGNNAEVEVSGGSAVVENLNPFDINGSSTYMRVANGGKATVENAKSTQNLKPCILLEGEGSSVYVQESTKVNDTSYVILRDANQWVVSPLEGIKAANIDQEYDRLTERQDRTLIAPFRDISTLLQTDGTFNNEIVASSQGTIAADGNSVTFVVSTQDFSSLQEVTFRQQIFPDAEGNKTIHKLVLHEIKPYSPSPKLPLVLLNDLQVIASVSGPMTPPQPVFATDGAAALGAIAEDVPIEAPTEDRTAERGPQFYPTYEARMGYVNAGERMVVGTVLANPLSIEGLLIADQNGTEGKERFTIELTTSNSRAVVENNLGRVFVEGGYATIRSNGDATGKQDIILLDRPRGLKRGVYVEGNQEVTWNMTEGALTPIVVPEGSREKVRTVTEVGKAAPIFYLPFSGMDSLMSPEGVVHGDFISSITNDITHNEGGEISQFTIHDNSGAVSATFKIIEDVPTAEAGKTRRVIMLDSIQKIPAEVAQASEERVVTNAPVQPVQQAAAHVSTPPAVHPAISRVIPLDDIPTAAENVFKPVQDRIAELLDGVTVVTPKPATPAPFTSHEVTPDDDAEREKKIAALLDDVTEAPPEADPADALLGAQKPAGEMPPPSSRETMTFKPIDGQSVKVVDVVEGRTLAEQAKRISDLMAEPAFQLALDASLKEQGQDGVPDFVLPISRLEEVAQVIADFETAKKATGARQAVFTALTEKDVISSDAQDIARHLEATLALVEAAKQKANQEVTAKMKQPEKKDWADRYMLTTAEQMRADRVVTLGSESLFRETEEIFKPVVPGTEGKKLEEQNKVERQSFGNQELFAGSLVAEYCMDSPLTQGDSQTVRQILDDKTVSEERRAETRAQFYTTLEEVYVTIGMSEDRFKADASVPSAQLEFALQTRARLKALNKDRHNLDTLITHYATHNTSLLKHPENKADVEKKLRDAFDMKDPAETQIYGLSAYALEGIEYLHKKADNRTGRAAKKEGISLPFKDVAESVPAYEVVKKVTRPTNPPKTVSPAPQVTQNTPVVQNEHFQPPMVIPTKEAPPSKRAQAVARAQSAQILPSEPGNPIIPPIINLTQPNLPVISTPNMAKLTERPDDFQAPVLVTSAPAVTPPVFYPPAVITGNNGVRPADFQFPMRSETQLATQQDAGLTEHFAEDEEDIVDTDGRIISGPTKRIETREPLGLLEDKGEKFEIVLAPSLIEVASSSSPEKKKRKKELPMNDTIALLAYYNYEKRVSGNQETNLLRAQTQLELPGRENITKAKLAVEAIKTKLSHISFLSFTDGIAIQADIAFRKKTKGLDHVDDIQQLVDEQKAVAEGIIDTAWQSALQETKQHFEAMQTKTPPSQEVIKAQANDSFLAQVDATGAEHDWKKAKEQAHLSVGVRAYEDIHNLGFSLVEIVAMGEQKNRARLILMINEKNTELGLRNWQDDTATRRYIGYAIRAASIKLHQEENIAREQAHKFAQGLYLKKIAQQGVVDLRELNVDLSSLEREYPDDDTVKAFISVNGWPESAQTREYVLALHEEIMTQKVRSTP